MLVTVEVTKDRWREIIEEKHPIMKGKLELVRATLSAPSQIRQSNSDPDVYLYYGPEEGTPYFFSVVVKHLYPRGFLITAYRTDRIKEGKLAWTA